MRKFNRLVIVFAVCMASLRAWSADEQDPGRAYDFSLASDAHYNNFVKDLKEIETNLEAQVGMENKELGDGIPPRVEIIADSSGSMGQLLANDKSRMYYMKKILTRYFLDQYKLKAETGLRVYGAKRRGDCSDNELRVPFSQRSLDKAELEVAKLAPLGRTPLYQAVKDAANDLKSYKGPRAMIVFTDGEDTCGGNPCAEGKEVLKDPRLNVQIFVVALGFKPGSDDLKKISCLGETSTVNTQNDLFNALGSIHKKIFKDHVNLVVNSPDPTAAVQVFKQVDGQWKPFHIFTAAFGTTLPPGEYQAVVQLNPPYRFGSFKIPPRKRIVLTVAGGGKLNVEFLDRILDVEVLDKNMKLVKQFKSDSPEAVPNGRWRLKIHKPPFFEKFVSQYDVAPGGVYTYKVTGASAYKVVSKDIVGFYVYGNKNNLMGNYLTNFPFVLPTGSYKIHVNETCTFDRVEAKDDGTLHLLECKP